MPSDAPTVWPVVHEAAGPWHQGFAKSFTYNGHYVTVVCGDPDVAEAIAQFHNTSHPWPTLPPRPAIVGTSPRPTEHPRRRL